MTGPDNPPPPGGPGRDAFGDYELQLRTVGCEAVDPLAAWAEDVAAAAPPLTDEQFALLAPLFTGKPLTGRDSRPTPGQGHLPIGAGSPARRDLVEPARASGIATSGGPGPSGR